MASKVFVGLPQHGSFSQGKKREEVVNLGYLGSNATNPELRVRQLEQSIRFLQEQHQIMLSGLHREVEALRRRNRDLQFQMVFKGGVTLVQTSPTSSPEDDCTRTIAISPGQVNITPLQVELLERDLAELKTNLGEARTRNMYLQGVVDEQKKAIQTMEMKKDEISAVGKRVEMAKKPADSTPSAEEPESVDSLKDKLDETDRMVRRLRRENEEQRKEIVSLRTSVGKSMAENRRSGGGGGAVGSGYHQGRIQNQQSQTSRFPPLYPPQHWNTPRNNGDYYKGEKGGSHSGREGESSHSHTQGNTSLPLLKERNSGPNTSNFNNSSYNFHQGQGQGQSGNHRRGYHRGSRTYRNNFRDPDQD